MDDTRASPCYVAQLCVGSVLASTGLIILNKIIVQFYSFPYGKCTNQESYCAGLAVSDYTPEHLQCCV